MIRILFSILAVVVAVLALVLKQPLLYAAAAAMALLVVIIWVAVLRRRHREAAKAFTPRTTAPPLPEEDLQSLGIMEIRPKASPKQPARPVDGAPEAEAAAPPLQEFVAQPVSSAEAAPVRDGQAETPPAAPETPDAAPTASAIGPYLQALRAALGAHTTCLLEKTATTTYRVLACVDAAGLHYPAPFSPEASLLTPSMARQPLTVRRVADVPRQGFGYRTAPPRRGQVALAPAPAPADAYLLVADSPRDDLLNQPHAHALLTQFAALLPTLLDVPTLPATATSEREAAAPEPTQEDPTQEPIHEAPLPEAPAVRPRREIIAEEMEQARRNERLLALALVYLNRAEDIALLGQGAVDEAEDRLAQRLRQTAPEGRVERFGELTYGIFYEGNPPEVEAWGAQIQQALSDETDVLEGGVSIGIAVLNDRHQTPDAFRADATEALREAYETGTCTILE